MVRPPQTHDDPAGDAAALLRRVGFIGLFVVVPVAALFTRRALVVLAPIAIALLILASALDGGQRPLRATLGRLAGARTFLAAGILALWCLLSLAWTPFLGPATERLANILAMVALAFAGYLALPDRMRSANLYLLPIGVGAAGIAGIVLGFLGGASLRGGFEEDTALERGLTLLALLAWPAVAWLRSRGRDLEALGIAVVTALALVLAPRPLPLVALGIGAAAYALASLRRDVGVRITAGLAAGLLALGPLVPFALRPFMSAAFGSQHPLTLSVRAWARIEAGEGLRLVTGHGFETALRGRFVGLLPPDAPTSVLFALWYELGVVGALSAAFALYGTIRHAGGGPAALVPGAMAAFAATFAFACLGVGLNVMWWFTAVAVLVLAFVATERGQFRTHRPKAGGAA
jgi:hypothetical protein